MKYWVGCLKKYADFSGRATRLEYWNFTLFNLIVMLVVALVDLRVRTCGVLVLLYQLIVFLPALAVNCRRLHDTGRSGWAMLISLIPVGGPIAYLVFMCSEGMSGANQYGKESLDLDWDLEHNFLESWTVRWISLFCGLVAFCLCLLFGVAPQPSKCPEVMFVVLVITILSVICYMGGCVGAFVGLIVSALFGCSEKGKCAWKLFFFSAAALLSGALFVVMRL